MRTLLVCAIASLAIPTTSTFAQGVRDNRTLSGVGTAAITGMVVSDEREARSLRRARVSITGSELEIGRTTVTTDDGTFSFDQLPAGRYSVTASKDGYVTMSAGADRPGRAGAGVEVRQGETGRVSVRLPKGAVITGIVRLPTGEPAAGISVSPMMRRYVAPAGERRLTASAFTTVATDDRGVYRIFGLAAGTYLVSALPRSAFAPGGAEIYPVSEADVRRALSEVKAQSTAPRPGMISPSPSASRPAEPPRGGVTLTPVYFPGTPAEKQATPVTVAAGEVRTGIDIDLEYFRTAAIEGFVTLPPGLRAQLLLSNADGSAPNQTVRVSVMTADDGRFSFRSLPPGHYAITARAIAADTRSGATPAQSLAWGRTEVMLNGDDITGITIPLRPALTLSGRIAFKGSTAAPALPTIRLPIPATAFTGGLSGPLPSVQLEGDRFSMGGALPGVYRFQAPPPGLRAPIGPWWLESVIVKEKDLLDTVLDLRESIDDAVVTFSDRASEVSGTARYQNGQAFREGLVVVFSTNRDTWFLNSRRIAAVQPSATGQYAFRNLPPGDYFITVAVGLERNEWFDPELLASLTATAQRLNIAGTEVKTHDLVLK